MSAAETIPMVRSTQESLSEVSNKANIMYMFSAE
jgi:hypothetical protein